MAWEYELLLLSFPRIRASDIFQISNPPNTRVCSCDMVIFGVASASVCDVHCAEHPTLPLCRKALFIELARARERNYESTDELCWPRKEEPGFRDSRATTSRSSTLALPTWSLLALRAGVFE